MQGKLREMCIINSNMSYKNSILRRAPFNKLYNFRVSDNIQSQLSEYAEKYLITHLEHNFKTLDFYKTAAQ